MLARKKRWCTCCTKPNVVNITCVHFPAHPPPPLSAHTRTHARTHAYTHIPVLLQYLRHNRTFGSLVLAYPKCFILIPWWIEDTPCTLYVAIAGMYSCVTAHSSNVVIPHYDTWYHTEAAKTPQPACIPTALESEHLHCFQCITLDLLTPHCDITATSKHTH